VYQLCQQKLGPAEEVRETGDEVRAPFLDREGPMKTIMETVSDVLKKLLPLSWSPRKRKYGPERKFGMLAM
jgi:hypothetical protein